MTTKSLQNINNHSLSSQLKELAINLTDAQAESFVNLQNYLLSEPMYPSLSNIIAPQEILTKHFLDSIAPLHFYPEIFKNQKYIFDLGSGAGFPIVPLAIMLPELKFVAIDSRDKSINFIKKLCEALNISNLSAIHSRIEDFARDPNYREKADLVMCRALSAVRTLLEYSLPLAKIGGKTLFYKGPKIAIEVQEARQALKTFQISQQQIKYFYLNPPDLPFQRGYLLINKTQPTSNQYPRKSGLPTKKPL